MVRKEDLGKMDLRADHGGLPVLEQKVFSEPVSLVHVVTFLNQTLKKRGYVFGLQKHPDGLQLSVYAIAPVIENPTSSPTVDE